MPARAAAQRGLAMLLTGLAALGTAADTAEEPFDFFDYLGSMVDDDGEWIDPVAMDVVDDDSQDEAETTEACWRTVSWRRRSGHR